MDKIVSVRAFAKEIGVSEGAVRKATKNWSFTIGVQEDGKINSTAAMNDPWVQKQLTVRAKAGVSRIKTIERLDSQDPVKEMASVDDTFTDLDLDSEDIASKIKISTSLKAPEAMRRREIIALALDKKKLQEQEGTLIRRDAVEKALFAYGVELKKALFNMAQRIVREIMAAPSEVQAHTIYNVELTKLLEAFGDFKKDLKSNG